MLPEVCLFESLFKTAPALQRHYTAGLLQERELYLRHLQERGQHPKTIKDTAELLLHVVQELDLDHPRIVAASEIVEAGRRWAGMTLRHRPTACKTSAERFSSAAKGWFRFQGLLEVARPLPIDPELDCLKSRFVSSLSHPGERLPATVAQIEARVRLFAEWACSNGYCLHSLSAPDIEKFVNDRRAAGWRPRTLAAQGRVVRDFLRFAEKEGLSPQGVSETIRPPRISQRDWYVTGPEWNDVRNMLDTMDTGTPGGCRAKAILLLAAVYGLRNREVTGLLLNDFDWFGETLTVRRLKRGRIQILPLRFEVGEAILHYLRSVRPRCACRNLFVTLIPPYRALHNLAPLVQMQMRKAGINSQSYGTHSLRHACATELLRQGASLRDIADLLGQRDIRSVSVYAKCDVRSLEEVANFDLRGVL